MEKNYTKAVSVYEKQPSRAQIGDIMELPTKKGLVYFQYTHKHLVYGTLIRVLHNFYDVRPHDFSILELNEERFFTFFPLNSAVTQKLVTVVAHADIPTIKQSFPQMRVPHGRDQLGNATKWLLWDGEKSFPIAKLDEKYAGLSIRSIWNYDLLRERTAGNWMPHEET